MPWGSWTDFSFKPLWLIQLPYTSFSLLQLKKIFLENLEISKSCSPYMNSFGFFLFYLGNRPFLLPMTWSKPNCSNWYPKRSYSLKPLNLWLISSWTLTHRSKWVRLKLCNFGSAHSLDNTSVLKFALHGTGTGPGPGICQVYPEYLMGQFIGTSIFIFPTQGVCLFFLIIFLSI